jgi:hypothetical protein
MKKNNLILVISSIIITLLVAEIPFRYLYATPWYTELSISKKLAHLIDITHGHVEVRVEQFFNRQGASMSMC